MKSLKIKVFAILLLSFSMLNCSGKESVPDKTPQAEGKANFAGVWITSVASSALNSRVNIQEAVSQCERFGITDIFVVVWNKGRTLYPSEVMTQTFGVEIDEQYRGRDPLAEMIEEAHRKNIKVHAWFEYGFAASNNQNGGLLLQDKPHWAAKDVNGALLKKNGFEWMNAFHPEVQDFMTSLILEVVRKYDVDGVQGDDRLPALPSHGGYDDYTVGLYKKEHEGKNPPADYKDAGWINWRADLLTAYFGRLYREVKKLKPEVIVSSAPSIHPWAKEEYLQDWPSWLKKGYVDMVIPQHYRYNIEAYQQVLKQQIGFLEAKDRGKFYPGVLIQNADYNPSPEFLKQMIEENRRQGFTGESFWFYEGLKKFPEFFEKYNRK